MTTRAHITNNRRPTDSASSNSVEAIPPPDHRFRRARPFRLTARDLELLEFVAAHRFVLACHVEALLGVDRAVAYRRLSGLAGVGLLAHQRIFHAQPGVYRITDGGLAVIDSQLSVPSVDLRTYRHDVGLVWLWLAARQHRFGHADWVLAEREMRSLDHRADDETSRFSIPQHGNDRHGRPRVHYPDVVVVGSDGGVALELELSLKGRTRLEEILLGYAHDAHVRRVVYVTDRSPVAKALCETVVRFGLGGLVNVRYLEDRSDRRDGVWWFWPWDQIRGAEARS
jgi:hypothetical protein